MKGIITAGLTAASALGLAVVLLNVGGSPSASAAGTGGTISLGAPSGLTIPVNTTAAVDAYKGFNLHITTNASLGVTLTAINGRVCTPPLDGNLDCTADPSVLLADSDATGGVDPGSLFCTGGEPLPDKTFGCIPLSGQSTASAGLLATFVLVASGNGCVDVNLISIPGNNALGTYTLNDADTLAQTNVVDTSVVHVFVGTGTLPDCPGGAAPTPTDTVAPTNTTGPTNTPTSTATPTPCSVVFGCPTPTSTLTPVRGITGTLTPTGTPPTDTPVPTDTATPGPGGATPPAGTTGGQPGGGARAGIRLPDTGSGPAQSGTSLWPLAVALLAALFGTSALLGATRARRS